MIPYLLKAAELGTSYNTTTKPIIAIMAQKLADDQMDDPKMAGYGHYVMADYVKFLEATGARIVPITTTESDEVTKATMAKVNGVWLPGGTGDDDYEAKARVVYAEAVRLNESGDYFPVFGVCQGYEYMVGFSADMGMAAVEKKEAFYISTTLEWLVEDPTDTKMFAPAGDQATLFGLYPFAFQHHEHGVDPLTFINDEGVKKTFRATSQQTDPTSGKTYVNTMEGIKYPFYGTQFHPEKVLQQYNEIVGLDHSWMSIKLNRYFADMFVEAARHNTHYWGTFEEVQPYVMNNYPLIVTTDYEGEVYAFP